MKQWRILRELWSPFTDSRASTYAASACYYILLSLLPALLLALALLPYLPTQEIRELLPQELLPLADYVLDLVQTADTLTIVSVSALVTLWSASKGILAISDGLNAVMEFSHGSSYLRRRIRAMVLFLLFIAYLAAAFLFFPRLTAGAGILVLWLFFVFLYRLVSGRRIPFRSCCLGSAFTTVGWLCFFELFSIYVHYFSRYQQLYGGVGLLLLGCIWLKYCILLVLYGGLLSKLTFQNSYHPLRILRQFFS